MKFVGMNWNDYVGYQVFYKDIYAHTRQKNMTDA
jgi:hypothetical protein